MRGPATESVGEPASYSAEGVADGLHRLYIYADESRTGCAATPHAESSLTPRPAVLAGSEGEALAAGPFFQVHAYTPLIQLPVVCAYLDDTPFDTPDVAATLRDPVDEYLENAEQAQPTGSRTWTLPGAIEPQPVDQAAVRAYWERVEREAKLRAEGQQKSSVAPTAGTSGHCVVPALVGRSLRAAHGALRRGHCSLGRVTVRGRGRGALVVLRQGAAHGTRLRSGAAVAVTVAHGGR